MKRQRPLLERLLGDRHQVFVFDPRGLGAVETRDIVPRERWADEGSEYKMACDAMMLGGSTLGLRVFDVTRALSYMRARDDCQGRPIGVYGVGFGALLGYLGAALDGCVDSLTAEDMLISYWHLAHAQYYNSDIHRMWDISWGLLRAVDLPNLLPCIAPGQCRLVNLRDAQGHVLDEAAVEAEFLETARRGGYLRGEWLPEIVLPRPIDARTPSVVPK